MRVTILFVDDNVSVRQYCKQELEADGYAVVLAEDGGDILERLAQSAVDAVVLDGHMPRHNGREVAEHIGQRYPTLPVILFTADPHLASCRSDAVRAVVAKSEDLSVLKATIRELTGRIPSKKKECLGPCGPLESLENGRHPSW